MSESSPRPENRPYAPQGQAIEILLAKDEVVMTDGGVGTGKSRACLEKLFACAQKYPGMRGLILRKTRKSCTETCLVTWEEEVVPLGHPCMRGGSRLNRHSYRFPNGSEIVVGGMDNPTKIMSSQWDFVYINEGLEMTQEEVEAVLTRMRNGKMPYQIILIDTNPDAPTHWLWKAHLEGRLRRIPTTLKDNRRFYSESRGELTPEGASYVAKLGRLTGSRRDRLVNHMWSIAEGAMFPQCDPNEHLFDFEQVWPQGIPESFSRMIHVDHGLRNPYCALWTAIDFDGNAWTYQEDYETGCPADIQAQRIRDKSHGHRFYAIYMDPSMWAQSAFATARPTALRGTQKSAADIYSEILGKDDRFGPLVPSLKDPSQGYPTLHSLLNRHDASCPKLEGGQCQCQGNGFPNWYIERRCTNLWEELNSAVFYRSPQGIWQEIMDPKCPNHAITAAAFGLAKHFEVPMAAASDELTIETLRRERLEERRKLSEQRFGKTFGQRTGVRY